MPVSSIRNQPAALTVLLLALATGCNCGPGPATSGDGGDGGGGAPDAHVDAGPADAGAPVDAGTPVKDAGPTVPPPPYQAGETCPDEAFNNLPLSPDGGTDIRFGLCVALRTLSGTATHNGAPLQDGFSLELTGSSNFRSQYAGRADAQGKYAVRVLKSRYEQLRYLPAEIFPTLQGMVDLGVADLVQDRQKDLGVKSWAVSGTAKLGGGAWASLAMPLDTAIIAGGTPSQTASVRNQAGTYAVRLMEGVFELNVGVPREALGDTALLFYPVAPLAVLDADRTVNIDLPSAELSGTLTVDGKPFPDRINGAYDYSFVYTASGAAIASVQTFHEGGVPTFKATLPKNTYGLEWELVDRADATYPSSLYNFQLANGVDLTVPSPQLNIALSTWKLEGVVAIDGNGVQPAPNTKFWFYGYAYENTASGTWFLSYYSVPTANSAFVLRAFPGKYYFALYLDSSVQSELADGWYVINRSLVVDKDISVPVDIATSVLEGSLTIDGAPANAAQYAGTFTFIPTAGSAQQGSYRYRVRTSDGTFRVRLPQARYEVYFEINPQAYPEYASGRQRVQVELDATGPTSNLEASYVTRRVVGPFRVAGEAVPDSLGGRPVARLELNRAVDHVVFTKALAGGTGTFSLRVPVGEYTASAFALEKDALPQTAWGDAPLGGPRLVVK